MSNLFPSRLFIPFFQKPSRASFSLSVRLRRPIFLFNTVTAFQATFSPLPWAGPLLIIHFHLSWIFMNRNNNFVAWRNTIIEFKKKKINFGLFKLRSLYLKLN